MALLSELPVGLISYGPPYIRWSLSPSGIFSVSSFANLLKRQRFSGLSDFPLSVIWRRPIPTKITGFLWQVFHKNISTCDNLARRGFIGPNMCVMCRVDLESVSHLFFTCDYAYLAWSSLISKLAMFGPFSLDVQEVIREWQSRNCLSGFESFRNCVIHAVFWYLWGERNNRIFRDLKTSPTIVVSKIIFAVGRWLYSADKVSKGDRLLSLDVFVTSRFGLWMIV
ncbi:Putative ribonuclease H protein At1g65750 [Linum perenne]